LAKQNISFTRKLLRFLLRSFLFLFVASMIYVVVGRWLLPPITVTQASAIVGGYGLKRDYVAWEDISPEIKLAAIASEDQLFTDHDGFDWKSIEKSMDEKKGKRRKQKGAGASTISQQTAKNVFFMAGEWLGQVCEKSTRSVLHKDDRVDLG